MIGGESEFYSPEEDPGHPEAQAKDPSRPYRCIVDNKCTYSNSSRRHAGKHVLRHHTDESRVAHGCRLCGFRCKTLSQLKSHRSWHRPHIAAIKRAATCGKKINEGKMGYRSNNPVNLDELIEKDEGEKDESMFKSQILSVMQT